MDRWSTFSAKSYHTAGSTYSQTVCAFLWLAVPAALGVRGLTWEDNRRDIWRVQTGVTEGYKDSRGSWWREISRLSLATSITSGIRLVIRSSSPGSLIAGESIHGDSRRANTRRYDRSELDLLIALELLPAMAAVIVGLFAAISPQLAYFAVCFCLTRWWLGQSCWRYIC